MVINFSLRVCLTTSVLAFLYKNGNEFFTWGMSYGEKTLNQADYEVYKRRILEIRKILKIKNEKERNTKTTDLVSLLCS